MHITISALEVLPGGALELATFLDSSTSSEPPLGTHALKAVRLTAPDVFAARAGFAHPTGDVDRAAQPGPRRPSSAAGPAFARATIAQGLGVMHACRRHTEGRGWRCWGPMRSLETPASTQWEVQSRRAAGRDVLERDRSRLRCRAGALSQLVPGRDSPRCRAEYSMKAPNPKWTCTAARWAPSSQRPSSSSAAARFHAVVIPSAYHADFCLLSATELVFCWSDRLRSRSRRQGGRNGPDNARRARCGERCR